MISEALASHERPPSVRLQGNAVRGCTCRACSCALPRPTTGVGGGRGAFVVHDDDNVQLDVLAKDPPFKPKDPEKEAEAVS